MNKKSKKKPYIDDSELYKTEAIYEKLRKKKERKKPK